MFDFSFGKLAIIFVLCLIVLGPEKLPKLAQTLGRLAGQARAMARHFRDQLEQEIAAEELAKHKRELEAAMQQNLSAITQPIGSVQEAVQAAAKDIAPVIDPGAANDSGHRDYEPPPAESQDAARVTEPLATAPTVSAATNDSRDSTA